jgi:hypothetical protein
VTCGNRDIKLVNAAPLARLDFIKDLVARPDDDSGTQLPGIYLPTESFEAGMSDIVPLDLACAQPGIARVVTHCAGMHGKISPGLFEPRAIRVKGKISKTVSIGY